MYSQEYSSYSPLVSIVIPARNEAKDIAATLEACLAIEYGPKEIIVVDDFTDETPQIVGQYAERGVRLIHRSQNRNGCCGARNLGMQSAEGEIIVLMNADDRPQPDFIQRIMPHYQGDIDFVVVARWCSIAITYGGNLSSLREFDIHPDPLWSEGFSCRKSAAKAVGYIPGDFPIPFCRDNPLGRSLGEARFVKHIDRNVELEHVSPSTLPEFWRNQVSRNDLSLLTHIISARFPCQLLYYARSQGLLWFILDLILIPSFIRMIGLRHIQQRSGGHPPHW